MADIKLVIEIPEELKNKIDNANEDNYRTYMWWFDTTLYCAIKDGTPLPKGHGKIIDETELKKELIRRECSRIMYDTLDHTLSYMKPIIKADKEDN